jgi:hypothetical protein
MITERTEFPAPPPIAITPELGRRAERVLERLREQVARQRRH